MDVKLVAVGLGLGLVEAVWPSGKPRKLNRESKAGS